MKTVNILGFGTMGMQLAAFFYVIGYKVNVWNRSFSEAKLSQFNKRKKIIGRKLTSKYETFEVKFFDNFKNLPPAITIEALAEVLDVKKTVIYGLQYEFETPWLFTNSSSFTPDEIHDSAHALHFFNPIHSMSFIETTCSDSSLQIFNDIKNAGMEVVHVKMNRGFIANYILFREVSAALMLVEKYDYNSKSIDAVLSQLGRQSSVFDIIDFVGVDVTKNILENLQAADSTVVVPKILQQALDVGIMGKKNKTTIRAILDSH